MNRRQGRVEVQRLTPAGQNFFFGYYDKCPWSRGGERVIAGRTDVSGRIPGTNDSLTLGFLDIGNGGDFQPVAETRAWNFQQGAMAQWLYLDGEEFILFNVADGGRAHARLLRPSSGVARDLALPVYALSADGLSAASVDFGRLQRWRPGYGYASVMSSVTAVPAPSEDGLALVDVRRNTFRLLVSYAELADQILPRGQGAPHWIDHIEFSPDSQGLVFLHRWLAPDGGPLTRVMAVDADGSRLGCLLDCGAAGHGLWLNEREYGIWGRQGKLAANVRSRVKGRISPLGMAIRLARKFIPLSLKSRLHQEAFLVLNVRETAISSALKQIPHGERGGHPSLHPGGHWVVSDTLPDAEGRRLLFLASLDGKDLIPLVSFVHDAATANSNFRCDFHPRWDRNGGKVCIDSLHEGYRGLYVVDVSEFLPRLQ